jgi:tetratricopeptide (TPR) repeat protein
VRQNSNYLPQVEHAYREAIKQFEIVLRDNPKQPHVGHYLAETHALLGDVLWRSARSEDAEASFQRAIEIYDQHPVEEDDLPGAGGNYAFLAYHLASTGREKEARVVLDKALSYVPRLPPASASADTLYYLAVALARVGDKAGYRATCKALVELPFDNLEGLTKSRPIWTPCIGPDALDDPTLPVKLGEEFVKNSTSIGEPHYGLYILGAAHYRAGQYEQAAQRLEESIAVYPSNPVPGHDTMNYHRLLLAMTQWQLGEQDEARRLLAETLPEVQKELNAPASSWNRRATLEILRHEAETLIEPKQADEAVENKTRTNDPP